MKFIFSIISIVAVVGVSYSQNTKSVVDAHKTEKFVKTTSLKTGTVKQDGDEPSNKPVDAYVVSNQNTMVVVLKQENPKTELTDDEIIVSEEANEAILPIDITTTPNNQVIFEKSKTRRLTNQELESEV
ncbi:hypothetical protein [Aequorivita viscosa]|uniref:Uncharacterized protein n=1 Tax=Aequorivita viscosa TaxID=797419 RepID=A0A1M6ATD9_9FLAO|nr:hypothetical protein [Aequorivita viscosa]SDW29726.1 hypothetical protein SAMN05216556_10420 [Aequorivita viscosa]SHI39730.1 hypothetical protein SAMN04487908_10220 [Aequorivita viscosa]